MLTTEIRIGNLVKFCGDNNFEVIFPVSDISHNSVVYSHFLENELPIDKIQPIRLNTEWVKKFGFERGTKSIFGNEFFIKTPSKTNANQVIRKFRLWEADNNYLLDLEQFGYGDELKIEINHVHLLQNVYFFLTGEKLNINDRYLQGLREQYKISVPNKDCDQIYSK